MNDFSLAGVEPTGGFSPFPPGDYELGCVKAEMMDTRAGGRAIKMEFVVLSGNHEKRKIWEYVNVQHPDPETALRGRSDLVGMMFAFGWDRSKVDGWKLNNIGSLVGCRGMSHVKIQKSDQYGDKNVISYWHDKPALVNHAPGAETFSGQHSEIPF